MRLMGTAIPRMSSGGFLGREFTPPGRLTGFRCRRKRTGALGRTPNAPVEERLRRARCTHANRSVRRADRARTALLQEDRGIPSVKRRGKPQAELLTGSSACDEALHQRTLEGHVCTEPRRALVKKTSRNLHRLSVFGLFITYQKHMPCPMCFARNRRGCTGCGARIICFRTGVRHQGDAGVSCGGQAARGAAPICVDADG